MTNKEDDEYMFDRGYQDSARLTLQHWLWLYRLKYVLHPSIPAQAEHLKIVDVGTGNAVWIMEVVPHLAASARMDDFDISDDQFPAREWLPENVSLDLLDILGDVPKSLVEQSDIVHLRTFAVVVKNNDPRKLLQNLIKLLKPGGYLQWDEMDLNTFVPSVVNPSASKAAADEFMAMWKSECTKSGTIYDWIANLGTFFKEQGLTSIDATTFSPINEQRKAFTDNGLMGVENTYKMLTRRGSNSEVGTNTRWRKLFEKMVIEMKNGASITADLIVVVGQKPKQSHTYSDVQKR